MRKHVETGIREYFPIDDYPWDAASVSRLRDTDRDVLYGHLLSIMQADDNEGDWKGELAMLLLAEERNPQARERVWSSLAVLARSEPAFCADELAATAWGSIDTFESRDAESIELELVEIFLSDLRIYGFPEPYDPHRAELWLGAGSRFKHFAALHALAVYGDISATIERIPGAIASTDFVARDAAIDAIGSLYTRPDCTVESLGGSLEFLQACVAGSLADRHWYVRESARVTDSLEKSFLADPD